MPRGTVDRLAKDQEAGPGLGWGEAAKLGVQGTVEEEGCFGRHSGVGSQPATASDPCVVPGPRRTAGGHGEEGGQDPDPHRATCPL